MVVEKYNRSDDIVVKFPDSNYTTNSTWANFKKGHVRNPFDLTVCGVGFIGNGAYKTKDKGRINKRYDVWTGMLRRCYSNEYSAYKNAYVCDEWHNYQNFAKWFDENFYQVEGSRMELDKDILIKGNKTYSPQTSIFAPQRINSLFAKCSTPRKDIPIGVEWCKKDKKYRVNYSNEHAGYYDSAIEAFYHYKESKEKQIKEIAEEYKNKIPRALYNAMIAYQVEITD